MLQPVNEKSELQLAPPEFGVLAKFMDVIFLGTGTSQGVPMIACACSVCTSTDLRNHRTRTSIHVIMDGLRIQVDAAPEFRLQCLREKIDWIDFFILTHGHADHIAGMDDLRRYCDLLGNVAMPVYSTDEGMARIRAMYPYAIADKPISKGYVAFRLQPMPARIDLPQGTIESTLLPHGGVSTLGLVFTEKSSGARFTYYTDCKWVTEDAVALAKGSAVVVLDGLRPEPHPTHMSISEAVQAAGVIAAPLTYLTHLTHLTDHVEGAGDLPIGVEFAYDGLRLSL